MHKHVDSIAVKDSLTLGFLCCIFRDCRKQVRSVNMQTTMPLSNHYLIMLQIPGTHTKVDIYTLSTEEGQVCNTYNDRASGCVTTNLDSLNWILLTTRPYNQHTIMIFKLRQGLVEIVDCTHLCRGDQRTRVVYRFYQPPSTLSIHRARPNTKFILLRTIND